MFLFPFSLFAGPYVSKFNSAQFIKLMQKKTTKDDFFDISEKTPFLKNLSVITATPGFLIFF